MQASQPATSVYVGLLDHHRSQIIPLSLLLSLLSAIVSFAVCIKSIMKENKNKYSNYKINLIVIGKFQI